MLLKGSRDAETHLNPPYGLRMWNPHQRAVQPLQSITFASDLPQNTSSQRPAYDLSQHLRDVNNASGALGDQAVEACKPFLEDFPFRNPA